MFFEYQNFEFFENFVVLWGGPQDFCFLYSHLKSLNFYWYKANFKIKPPKNLNLRVNRLKIGVLFYLS